jgi:hypothetical protein
MFVGRPTTRGIKGAMQVQMFGLRMREVKSVILHDPTI